MQAEVAGQMGDLADAVSAYPAENPQAADDSIMVFLRAAIGAFDAGKPEQAIALLKALVEFEAGRPNRAVPYVERPRL